MNNKSIVQKLMIDIICVSFFFILSYGMVYGESGFEIEWQKCLGGSDYEYANSIQETSDGGYIIAGPTESNDGDVTGHHGGEDCWIIKLDSQGSILWQKCLGGSGNDSANSIEETSDGGYVICGYSTSNDGDVTGNHGLNDCWIVKLDSQGSILWQKCLGGSGNDSANSIQETSDGGYVVCGYTKSNDGDVTSNHGLSALFVNIVVVILLF